MDVGGDKAVRSGNELTYLDQIIALYDRYGRFTYMLAYREYQFSRREKLF